MARLAACLLLALALISYPTVVVAEGRRPHDAATTRSRRATRSAAPTPSLTPAPPRFVTTLTAVTISHFGHSRGSVASLNCDWHPEYPLSVESFDSRACQGSGGAAYRVTCGTTDSGSEVAYFEFFGGRTCSGTPTRTKTVRLGHCTAHPGQGGVMARVAAEIVRVTCT